MDPLSSDSMAPPSNGSEDSRSTSGTTEEVVRRQRGVYCNRTLNLRAIRAIGYDMDYTLVHYNIEEWERAAFERARASLASSGWPTELLEFDSSSVIQGLVIDTELGNVVKATRFGYVIRAQHGGHLLSFTETRDAYHTTIIDLAEPRWQFLNTLFSLSEGCLYMGCIDLFDRGLLPATLAYRDVYQQVRLAIDGVHARGDLQEEIARDPERFVEVDRELALTLLDQKNAGKTLMLITNSGWQYASSILTYVLDPVLPRNVRWRTLFDFIIASARKPGFFSGEHATYLMVDEEEFLLRPHSDLLVPGAVHLGGDAALVERTLGVSGAEILYVGDHLFGDVNASKVALRWRTGLVLRELESEIAALASFSGRADELDALMARKVALDNEIAHLRLDLLRAKAGYVEPPSPPPQAGRLRTLARRATELEQLIGPFAKEASELGNRKWGPLLRAGNDKSLFARQLENNADIYFSRVSNLLSVTPFGYLRASRGSLPHD